MIIECVGLLGNRDSKHMRFEMNDLKSMNQTNKQRDLTDSKLFVENFTNTHSFSPVGIYTPSGHRTATIPSTGGTYAREVWGAKINVV